MNQYSNIIRHIDNIEQDFKMLDNIFKCMNIYWKGEGADAVINTYLDMADEINEIKVHLALLKGILNE